MTDKQRKDAFNRDLDALLKKHEVEIAVIGVNLGHHLVGQLQGPKIEIIRTLMALQHNLIEHSGTSKPHGKKKKPAR